MALQGVERSELSKLTTEQRRKKLADTPRRQARRRQILNAAGECFRLHGFHGCSMLQISDESGMSVGHIYQFFDKKEEIIAAIAQEDIEAIVWKVSQFPTEGPNLKQIIKERADEGVMEASDPRQAALMLEVRAEAARNPIVQAVVREGDAKISRHLSQIIQAAVGRPLEAVDLAARVDVFSLIFQGIGIRTVINPAIDRKALSTIVKLAIDAILS